MGIEKKDNKRIKTSLILNCIVVLFTIFACYTMFSGFKFMHGHDINLESTKLGMFRFFTVDSNIFMGVVALLFAIKEIKLLNGKIEYISLKMYNVKLMATTSVGLTFFVVFAYLGPISEYGIMSLLMNSNLFFHLLIPLLSIISFVFFEKTDKLKFKYTFCGLIPVALYGTYYCINILTHAQNGKVSTEYDWYWFVQNGIWTAFIAVPLIFVLSYAISAFLWKFNRKY